MWRSRCRAARVGTNSSLGEKPMEAMIEGLTGSGDGATCNERFLRDDAVLVVVIITDEDDNGPHTDDLEGDSAGTPQAWVDALVGAKNGSSDASTAMTLTREGDTPGGISGSPDSRVHAAVGRPRHCGLRVRGWVRRVLRVGCGNYRLGLRRVRPRGGRDPLRPRGRADVARTESEGAVRGVAARRGQRIRSRARASETGSGTTLEAGCA